MSPPPEPLVLPRPLQHGKSPLPAGRWDIPCVSPGMRRSYKPPPASHVSADSSSARAASDYTPPASPSPETQADFTLDIGKFCPGNGTLSSLPTPLSAPRGKFNLNGTGLFFLQTHSSQNKQKILLQGYPKLSVSVQECSQRPALGQAASAEACWARPKIPLAAPWAPK